MRRVLLALLLAASPAWAQVEVENAWSRATAPHVVEVKKLFAEATPFP